MCLHIDYEDENIQHLVENYINSEDMGIDIFKDNSDEDNSRAMKILQETTKRVPVHI